MSSPSGLPLLETQARELATVEFSQRSFARARSKTVAWHGTDRDKVFSEKAPVRGRSRARPQIKAHALVLEIRAGPLPGMYDPSGPGRLLFGVFAAMAVAIREHGVVLDHVVVTQSHLVERTLRDERQRDPLPRAQVARGRSGPVSGAGRGEPVAIGLELRRSVAATMPMSPPGCQSR
ncbi:hypothetical protein AB0D97_36720 [Streptomyces roseus]|uniref:hypothetical protein n=1 Tax=Streptomyces roseus TaxID=66430 RepID=UPI0033C2A46C